MRLDAVLLLLELLVCTVSTQTPVLLLHVGKCAGSTVRFVLQNLKKPSGESCLNVSEVHMRQPGRQTPWGKIVMTTRDPLDRIVSAFNYRHPTRGYKQNAKVVKVRSSFQREAA